MEKRYEFRKLKAPDLFLVLNVAKKVGIKEIAKVVDKDDIVEAFNTEERTEKAYAKVAFAIFPIVQLLIEKMSEIENDLYVLLSETSNLSQDEVKNLEMDEFVAMIIDFMKKEEFPSFFKQVMTLLGWVK